MRRDAGRLLTFRRACGASNTGLWLKSREKRGGGRTLVSLLLAAFALLLAAATPAFAALTFPALTGRVVDDAHVLTPAVVQEITQRSEQLEQATGRQLVVATVKSLQDDDVQDYGYQLGRAWKIGRAGKNDGVILLVAPNERKVGIEVGYGLEPVLTDALTSVILQTRVLPKFKAGDMPGGVQAGADAIADQLALPDDQAQANVAQAATQKAPPAPRERSHGVPAAVILFILFFVFSSIFGRRGGRGGGGMSWLPWVVLGALSNSRGGGGDDWGGGGGGGGSSGSW